MRLQALEYKQVDCPYCGEKIDCAVDTSIANQRYIEDCTVCCAPIVFEIAIDIEQTNIQIYARRDNE
jgi:transcription elongation factor Elf1